MGMSSSDTAYYRDRATTERSLALAAGCQRVAAIHEELARLYQALIDQAELRPKLGLVFEERLSA